MNDKVSDHTIEVLAKHGLVKKCNDKIYVFKNKKLGFKCPSCGQIIPHYYADGGLYVSCEPCRTNWILYFTVEDLVRHLEAGATIVLDEANKVSE